MGSNAIDNPLVAQAKSLYRFLREYVDVRSQRVREVKQYEDVIWLDEFPEEGGAGTAIFSGTCPHDRPEAWLWAERLPHVPEPQRPVILADWAYLADADADGPRGPRQVSVEGREEAFDDDPDRVRAWQQWMRNWQAWHDDEQRRAGVRAVYERLFNLERRLEREGEQFELVIAVGLLAWRSALGESGVPVLRHLLVSDATVELDPTTGVITVQPPETGSTVRLEQDMLEVAQRVNDATAREVNDALADVQQILDPDQVRAVLTRIANVLDPDSHYSEETSRSPSASSSPQITFAPALILRRRGERALVQAYDTILEQLEEGEVPVGVQALLDTDAKEIAPDEKADETALDALDLTLPDEHLLPLPANDEQIQIVRRLERERGVVVQGPPGTGKSHTIANLICDLLAKGNRVLVTSETSQALQVLQDKLPASMSSLCVSVLGSTRGANTPLSASINGILAKKNAFDERRSAKDIDRRTKELSEAHQKLQEVFRALVESREAEVRTHDLGGPYNGSLSQIAARMAEDEQRYGPLTLAPTCADECPLEPHEATELLELLRARDVREADQMGLPAPGVSLGELPEPDAVAGWLAAERSATDQLEAARKSTTEQLAAAQSRADDARREATRLREAVPDVVIPEPAAAATLRRTAHGIQDALGRAESAPYGWAPEECAGALAGRESPRKRLAAQVKALLATVSDDVSPARGRRLTGVEGRALVSLVEQAEGLRTHLAGGGKMKAFLSTPAPVRRAEELLEHVRLDGSPPDDLPTLDAAIPTLKVAEAAERGWRTWGEEPATLGDPARLFDDLRAELEAFAAVEDVRAATAALVAEARRARYPLETPLDDAALLRLLDALDAHDAQVAAESAARDAQAAADAAQDELDAEKTRGGSEVAGARRAVESAGAPRVEALRRLSALSVDESIPELGALRTALSEPDEDGYRRSYRTIAEQLEWFTRLDRRRELTQRLESAGAAALVESMGDDPGPEWDARLESLGDAWLHVVADRRLSELTDLERQHRLERELDAEERKVSSARAELASALAWHHLFTRMHDSDAQHLQAYAESMRKLGKGTGKYAATHRANAQKHLAECQSAVPAWIMPLFQVAQTVRIEPNRFDVVIVDEASQAGIEAMHLFFLAPKIIVVGDQEQISPQGVGIDRSEVQELQHKFLDGVPHGDQLDVQSNLFAQAQIRFPGVVALREHFRCMPEIIEFSNQLCYAPLNQPLTPLRQFGSDRLTPLRNVFVPKAFRANRSSSDQLNEREAEALICQVEECIADPAYRDRTMGIISLLGNGQVKLLTKLLAERIAPAEIHDRRIRVGNPYAFQGDERDVMFLSMVTTMEPGVPTRAETSADTKRRFNVAASRARDQMWLFHSVKVEDLRPDCLRRRLLTHVVSPATITIDGGPNRDQFDDEILKPPFDSIFEQQVYRRITERGYTVVPQFEVGSYRIDLAVVGGTKLLAVECDGDQFHTAENLEYDLGRERDLRRAGWDFVRIRGGAFFRDKDAALEPLWEKLREMDLISDAASAEEAAEASRPDSGGYGRSDVDKPLERSEAAVADVASGYSMATIDEVPPDLSDEAGLGVGPAQAGPLVGAASANGREVEAPDSADDGSGSSGTPAYVMPSGLLVEVWGSSDPYLSDYSEIETASASATKLFPDPREGKAKVVQDGLLGIVEVEGPMLASRLFSAYVKCGGRHRVTAPIHKRLVEQLERLRQLGKITVAGDVNEEQLVYASDQPSIVPRVRGPRTLAEIPLSEIAAVVADVQRRKHDLDDESLKREVLARLDLQRLTPAAETRLGQAIAIANFDF
jgi:very-short-patch-repair endonuclease